MKARFKADLDGMLEYFEKIPSARENVQAELLRMHFDPTFEHVKSCGGREALANIIFTAVRKRKESAKDFDVPRFAEGLRASEFLKLVNIYDLYAEIVNELYQLEEKVAISALRRIFEEAGPTVQAYKSNLYSIYTKLLQNLDDRDKEFYCKAEDAFIEEICNNLKDPTHLTSIVGVLRDSLMRISRNQTKRLDFDAQNAVETNIEWKKVRISDCIDRIYSSYPGEIPGATIDIVPHTFRSFSMSNSQNTTLHSMKRKRMLTLCLENKNCQNVRTPEMSLNEAWSLANTLDTTMSRHEQAFVVICTGLKQKSFPVPARSRELSNQSSFSPEDLHAFKQLEAVIRNDETTDRYLKSKKMWCIDALMNRSCFWVSVLKIIIQFIDLWMNDIVESKSETLFASLISRENLLGLLLKRFSQIVETYKQTYVGLDTIKKISKLFEQSIEYVTTLEHIDQIRYVLIKQTANVRLPGLGLEEIWNLPFDTEMTLLLNQLTVTEGTTEDLTAQNIPKRLLTLSIIWPYKTVYRLIQTCIYNRDQYKAVVPIMKSLVFEDMTTSDTEKLSESMFMDIPHIFKSLFTEKADDSDCPIILKDACDSQVVDSFISYSVNRNLILQNEKQEEPALTIDHTKFKLGLYILNSFCAFPPGKEKDWNSYVKELDYIPYMESLSSKVGLKLTFMLDVCNRSKRHQLPACLTLKDKERILSYIEKLSACIREVIRRFGLSPGWETEMLLEALKHEPDYQNLLIWNDNLNCFSYFKVLEELKHKLDTYRWRIDISREEWNQIFKVCMLSKDMANRIFKDDESLEWKENLKLLSKHPYECEIIKQGFRQALHPGYGFSLAPLFPKLLVHFLCLLFEASSVKDILLNYQYTNFGMNYLIQRLTHSDLKQFFTILYTTQLIQDQLNESSLCEDDNDYYYVVSLIKAIRDLNVWSKMCHFENSLSYGQLKELLKNDSNEVNEFNYITETDSDMRSTRETSQSEQNQTTLVTRLHYPILDQEMISKRALSLLTIICLCSLSPLVNDNEMIRIMLFNLILQITEGLIDQNAQKDFEVMLSNQPKSRVTRWKKSKNPKRLLLLRPALTSDERVFMVHFLKKVDDSGQILQAFGLMDNSSLDDNKPLYII
ncbi:hypothetical protein G6F57_005066 [Rhizopus arrhizus]|uniref:Uncharacterized protein n=1 Tax=Rhizopus oryzae TaxID=64495 RepID=A0A9P6X9Z1_RHIOR|nr:hypothetical protein G6F21_004991 [Rhizopus arrhizus]KAG0799040.1 hypothetical protein G6F22_003625 [Rhizopus arrhizus]KAG0814557.1 hypothetical protein G6F20_004674 [Rhizopus arrhizus]KAG0834496.1 hypothetical protein G6F18_006279 [Rhizopus arrhizus]KAG0843760.1 hypothetical protein G6F19_000285 [Rhizopus arrhizus]